MATTYPGVLRDAALTSEEVHQFLSNPVLVARRIQELTDLKFVTDFLLRGSADATGTGAVLVEEDGGITMGDGKSSEVVAPGAEYPLLTAEEAAAALIALRKRGFDSEITDEKISRSPRDELNKLLRRMVGTIVKDFDSYGQGVIASKVTQTYAGGAWSSADRIVQDVEGAKAQIEELELGYSLNAVVLKPTQYAKAASTLVNAGLLPRESGNPILAGVDSFSLFGLDWVKSIHSPTVAPFLADVENLGGVATENIGSPGYTRTDNGIEVKTWRPAGRDDNDSTRLRVRRIAVPYVTGPLAALTIQGTGL